MPATATQPGSDLGLRGATLNAGHRARIARRTHHITLSSSPL